MVFGKKASLIFSAACALLFFILHNPRFYIPPLPSTVNPANRHADTQHPYPDSASTSLQPPTNPFRSTAALNSPGTPYTRSLVIGHLSTEDISWATDYITTHDQQLRFFPYAVDNRSAPYHTALNKAHEVMPYLTYIIEHYDTLADVSVFMHPHRRAWHTPELLNHDATELLARLNPERVVRLGYTNLRCHWDPGCPERIYPSRTERGSSKVEEVAVARAWRELFPADAVPTALGAPCCAQFAVARHRIQAIPKRTFERYRDWVVRTEEDDWTSGRIFEYLWQKVFADEAQLCPDARSCYCDGYGVCFTSDAEFEAWFDNARWWRKADEELRAWEAKAKKLDAVPWEGIEYEQLDVPKAGRNLELIQEMEWRQKIMDDKRAEALRNGTNASVRAWAVDRSRMPGL